MNWIKGLIAKVAGKKLADGTSVVSKAKLAAVVAVIMTGIQVIPPAFGYEPIYIPDWIYKLLASAGLWAVRDAIKS